MKRARKMYKSLPPLQFSLLKALTLLNPSNTYEYLRYREAWMRDKLESSNRHAATRVHACTCQAAVRRGMCRVVMGCLRPHRALLCSAVWQRRWRSSCIAMAWHAVIWASHLLTASHRIALPA